jgi:hypothetical protein
MTTKDAFEILLNDKEKCLEIMSDEYYRVLKHRYAKGEIANSRIEKLLEQAGWTKKITWKFATRLQK